MRVSKGLCSIIVCVIGLAFAAGAFAQEEEAKKEGEQKRPQRKSMIERLDGKGEGGVVDGKITLEEYKAGMAEMAEQRFKGMDKDEDGVLTEEEMRAGRRAFGRRRQAQGRGRGRGKRKAGGEGEGGAKPEAATE